MLPGWPRAAGEPVASGKLRVAPEDFRVCEELGFAPEGEGEHVFLHLEKRGLNTAELAQRLSSLSGVHPRNIGFSGIKDRNAVTRQWFSVGLAGRSEPDWRALEVAGEVSVLAVERHRRKLRRGVHRGNRFTLVVRELEGSREQIERRLGHIRRHGAPNYFGEQRFGRGGSTLAQARQWLSAGGRRVSRNKRSLFLSVCRSQLFNLLLAERVVNNDWDRVLPGDTCILGGTRSQFYCAQPDAEIAARCARGDLHPALPLWGRGVEQLEGSLPRRWARALEAEAELCRRLPEAGLALDWRPTRLVADDFCWQFCDDGSLQLEFRLGPGNYATALLAEFVRYS